MTGTFVAIGGLFGGDDDRPGLSKGLQKIGELLSGYGWREQMFHHSEGTVAGEWARHVQGPIILAVHSKGASSVRKFINALGRRVDLAIYVDSWFSIETDKRIDRVISVRATLYHVYGENVVEEVQINTSHTAVDDSPELKNLILAEANKLNQNGYTPPVVNPNEGSMEKFNHWTPIFMRTFMKDFDCSVEDAAAVFGNAGHESAGYEHLQEIKPTVPGSKGGYGIMQWTGSRRLAYEAYCARHGYDPAAMENNYKHLFNELTDTSEKRVLPLLKAASTLDEKVEVFCQVFLRPGIVHMDSRKTWARRAMDAWRNANEIIPAPEPEPPQTGDIDAYRGLLKDIFKNLDDGQIDMVLALSFVLGRGAPPGTGAHEMNQPASAGFSLPESKGNFMGNYSKLIGSLVGGVIGILVAKNILPPEFNTPEMTAALTMVVSAFAVFMFPANKPA